MFRCNLGRSVYPWPNNLGIHEKQTCQTAAITTSAATAAAFERRLGNDLMKTSTQEARNTDLLTECSHDTDCRPVTTLERQIFPTRTHVFLRRFEEATRRTYGFLIIDMKPGTKELLQNRIDVRCTRTKELTTLKQPNC
ncbi:Hypothetical predicted protein [Mytilus galloprovincialis]|uniref:Uncharacterized protein n=1 Tax=Mytilus galloprovincialis TaxID=29158 RepID=A0A8B6GRX1_MYTGA|nr:Hypothetical predicted protein [Mytilus galloprovincialis]